MRFNETNMSNCCITETKEPDIAGSRRADLLSERPRLGVLQMQKDPISTENSKLSKVLSSTPGSLCQDPAGNRTTRRPPDHRKEMQTEVVWKCLLFIRTGQNHLARHSERGKKTRQTEKEVGGQHQGMDRPGVHQVSEGSGERRKVEETGFQVICGAPTTIAIKG